MRFVTLDDRGRRRTAGVCAYVCVRVIACVCVRSATLGRCDRGRTDRAGEREREGGGAKVAAAVGAPRRKEEVYN